MSNQPPTSTLLPISRLFPNIVTIIGLCFGLFAIKHALSGHWEKAVIFIVVAAFIDGIDGRLARMLNVSSNFGAQLDSLADFLNFGVAPALILYMWKAHEIKAVGWAVALFFIISQALRLARFNCNIENDDKEENFFTGVPAPCGAGMTMIPMMLSFLFEEKLGVGAVNIPAWLVIIYMALIGILMISRIPTLSVKKMNIKKEYAMSILALAGIIVILFIIEPWIFLPLMGIGYLITIPFSIYSYYRKN